MKSSSNNIKELFNLEGKIALVTGGAGYLGEAISFALSESGAEVIVASREEAKCARLARQLPSKAMSMRIDITDDESVKKCAMEVKSKFGKLDILVNNAANVKGGQLLTMSSDDFNATLNGALTGVFRATKVFTPLMSNSKSGTSIINIASMYGMVSPDERNYRLNLKAENPPDYGAAKSGVIQLTRYFACKLAKMNIRVNSISPGPFPNPEKNPKVFIRTLAQKTPLMRVGEPWEIKGAVVFLSSRGSSYITGHNLVVDGGWTTW
jgi:gluconate 5-dehydrogenase